MHRRIVPRCFLFFSQTRPPDPKIRPDTPWNFRGFFFYNSRPSTAIGTPDPALESSQRVESKSGEFFEAQ